MTSSPDRAAPWVPLEIGEAGSSGRARPPAWDPPPADGAAWSPPELDGAGRSPQGRLGRPAAAEAVPDPVDEAFARGRDEGIRDGAAMAERRLQSALDAVRGAAEALTAARANLIREQTPNLQALAVAVAQKLIQRELAGDPSIARDLIGRAFELMPREEPIEVRLHPDDLQMLGRERDGLVPEGRGGAVQWIADASVDRGGFLLESPRRLIDGRPDVALRHLYERLEHE